MSAKSFEVDLVLDTDEALQNFLDALDEANRRGPMVLPDFSEEEKKWREILARERHWKD